MKIQVEKTGQFIGHRDCVYAISPAAEPDYFFSAGGDGLVVKWHISNPEQGELIARANASVYALCFMKADNQLLIGENFEGLHWLDLATKTEKKVLLLDKNSIFDIQVHGEAIFVGSGNGTLFVVDKNTFSITNQVQLSQKSLRCLAINPLSQEIAAGYSDHFIRIFDLKTQALKYAFEAHTNSVFTLQYSPDLRFLVSGSRDARIHAWHTADYSLHTSVAAHLFAINHLTYSPDARFFATASMDKSIKIWDSENFRLLKVIDKARHAGHGTSINKLLWTNVKDTIIAGSDDKTLSAWQLTFSGEML
ncbi:MAG: WD40 repeat domain-containing protein [Verrucomicrobia bacterium]|nr:WD40 repeat domain-containing protein [Cytophagales bacterium]